MIQIKLLIINVGLNFLLFNDTSKEIRDLQTQLGSSQLPINSIRAEKMTSKAPTTTTSTRNLRPTLPASPKNANLAESVTRFGAVPNDGIDDTVAIQKAIDTIADKGGGSVTFPPGTYNVSIQRQGQQLQALKLRSGIRLASSSTQGATIKLAARQGNYEAIMGTALYGTPLTDFVIEGLTIDSNGQNNPVLVAPASNNDHSSDFGDAKLSLPRAAFRAYSGKRIRIDQTRFTNQNAVWSVVVNGKPDEMMDVAITNSRFDNVGGNAIDFDHSSIYTSGVRMLVEKNIFVTRFGTGTKGARTAIEIHGDDQTIRGNTIKGYSTGINVTGAGTPTSQRQLYQDNVIEGVNTGFMLWCNIYPGSNPQQPGLQNITIRHNTVKINSDGWLMAKLVSDKGPSAGIVLEANSDASIQDLTIADNRIDFVNSKPIDYWHDHFSSGITLWKYTNQDTPIERAIVSGNHITNSPGAGIWSNARLGGKIENNLIVNPARSDQLSADNSGFSHVGIYLEPNSNNQNLYIQQNTIIDTSKESQLKYGIVANSKCIKNCVIRQNTIKAPGATTVHTNASWKSYNR